MTTPVKLFHRPGSRWVSHSHAPVFAIEPTSAGTDRLVAALPAREACAVFAALAELIEPPVLMLYVLHTPRGEAEAGRYQSPPLDRAWTRYLLKRFRAYLTADSRYDLWIRSEADKDSQDGATLVWDRHNLLYAYGPLDRFAAALTARGFKPGRPSMDFTHMHHFRPRFDRDATAWLEAFDWTRTPLREVDWQ